MFVGSERDMSHPRHEPRPLPSYPPAQSGPALPAVLARRPRPPLTKRMRPWHWMAIDFGVGAVAALISATTAAHGATAVQGPAAVHRTAVQVIGVSGVAAPTRVVLAAVLLFSIGLRRRYPVPAFSALVTMAVVASGTGPVESPLAFLAAAYVLYAVTVTSSKQTGVAALTFALAVTTTLVFLVRSHHISSDPGPGTYMVVAFFLIIAWMTGYSVRQRRLYAQMLTREAASSAVAEERLRIARELHDVVAHSMSVIAVQAGYGQYVIDASPADARDALGAIQATSRDALEEMRRMLGVLRQQDAAAPGAAPATAPAAGTAMAAAKAAEQAARTTGAPGPARAATAAPLAPAPGLADLERLIQRTRGAGVQVSLERAGLVRAVPAGVDLSAYRIIQEALTNVVKHAGGGARCTIALDYGERALRVTVTDDGGLAMALTPVGVAGAGHGIIGMRERANLCGGEFSAGPLPDSGFQVTAVLPLLSTPTGDAA